MALNANNRVKANWLPTAITMAPMSTNIQVVHTALAIGRTTEIFSVVPTLGEYNCGSSGAVTVVKILQP